MDGFHRYLTMRNSPELQASTGGLLPIVVIDKALADRMASTVRHNRARGTHSVVGMSTMVFAMLDEGWPDDQICNELGMQPEELLRLKHITGFAILFKDTEYSRAWVHKNQVKMAATQNENQENPPHKDQALREKSTEKRCSRRRG